jgi:pimeloyl-ACP methyl ester carboxylesterase
MASLARSLAAEGFRCVFFDAGGHGDARAEPVGFASLIADVGAVNEAVGDDVAAWIGHSAGALAIMAARALHGITAPRYVCISAPHHPYVPLERLRDRFGAPPEVLERVKPLLAAQFATDWNALVAGAVWRPQADGRLLLVHDTEDAVVEHRDADRIAMAWPGAEIFKTDGFGHNRVLGADRVGTRVARFLTGRDLPAGAD